MYIMELETGFEPAMSNIKLPAYKAGPFGKLWELQRILFTLYNTEVILRTTALYKLI